MTYASDGLALGFVIPWTEEPGPAAPFFDRRKEGILIGHWEAWVLEHPPGHYSERWPYMKRIDSFRSIFAARKCVEAAVRTGGLWP